MFVHLKEMIGRKYGYLTIIERVANNKYGQPMFKCNCDCGREHITAKSNLVRPARATTSCGCARYLTKKTRGDYRAGGACRRELEEVYPNCPSRLQQRVTSIKSGIYHQNKGLELSVGEILLLILKPCNYCGISDKVKGIGIDRVNSDIHYTQKNSVPCCKTCNYAKNNLTLEQFKQWLTRAYNYSVVQSNLGS